MSNIVCNVRWKQNSPTTKIDVNRTSIQVSLIHVLHQKNEMIKNLGQTNDGTTSSLSNFDNLEAVPPTLRSLIQGEALIKGEAGIFLQI